MSALHVCPSCQRHVRERACPFCGAEIEQRSLAHVPIVARAVLVAGIAAAAVVSTESCFGAYGGPPPEMAAPETAKPDAGTD